MERAHRTNRRCRDADLIIPSSYKTGKVFQAPRRGFGPQPSVPKHFGVKGRSLNGRWGGGVESSSAHVPPQLRRPCRGLPDSSRHPAAHIFRPSHLLSFLIKSASRSRRFPSREGFCGGGDPTFHSARRPGAVEEELSNIDGCRTLLFTECK